MNDFQVDTQTPNSGEEVVCPLCVQLGLGRIKAALVGF